jgi:hypothetical protein
MMHRSIHRLAFSGRQFASAGLAMLVFMIATGPTLSQKMPAPLQQAPAQQPAAEGTATTQPTQNETAPANTPAREENPGLINEIGKMFGKLPTLKSPGESIDDFNERAKDTAKDASDTLSRLTTPLMVTGRTVCPVSANGAPDCKTASDKLCQAKGFKEGKSLLTDSAETCSAKVLIPGRTRKPGDCRTDTFVTRALCQ